MTNDEPADVTLPAVEPGRAIVPAKGAKTLIVVDRGGNPTLVRGYEDLAPIVAGLKPMRTSLDPKLLDLARIGYRNPNGSKLTRVRGYAPPLTKAEIRAIRKRERDRKRDARRARR